MRSSLTQSLKNPPQFLNQEIVKNIIFWNYSPAFIRTPFKQFRDLFKVRFYLHSELFDLFFIKDFFSLETLAKVLSPEGKQYKKLVKILSQCQALTITRLLEEWFELWKEYASSLKLIDDLRDDPQSIMNWEVSKRSGIEKVLVLNSTGRLSLYQRRWVYANSIDDLETRNKEIETVFEMVKPWLDKELFFALKEKEDNTRVNVEFEKELEGIGLSLSELDLDTVSR